MKIKIMFAVISMILTLENTFVSYAQSIIQEGINPIINCKNSFFPVNSEYNYSWLPTCEKDKQLKSSENNFMCDNHTSRFNSQTVKYRSDTISKPDNMNYDLSNLINNMLVYHEFFIYAGMGITDIVYLGVGKNISENYRIALKADLFPLRGTGEGIRIASGLGIKFSKLFFHNLLSKSIFPIDNVSLEYSYGFTFPGYNALKYIGKYELNFGSEKINQIGLNFCWAIGVAVIDEQNKKPLVLPNFKFGLIYNF